MFLGLLVITYGHEFSRAPPLALRSQVFSWVSLLSLKLLYLAITFPDSCNHNKRNHFNHPYPLQPDIFSYLVFPPLSLVLLRVFCFAIPIVMHFFFLFQLQQSLAVLPHLRSHSEYLDHTTSYIPLSPHIIFLSSPRSISHTLGQSAQCWHADSAFLFSILHST